ncbi:MAG TPA: NBR1-Ig-like domain-containing protein [Anaerolineae bacterium]|nr:NBR1-Ig-like domain-containing protein [Anaerolineae bacterium]
MTTQRRYSIAFVFITMIVLSLACTLGGGTESAPTETPTASVTTVPTDVAAATFDPTLTLAPSDTPGAPTNTPTATATPIVGSGPGGCVLRGTYIADVTIPDGTVLAPNAPFVKTWRIRNDGTCTWDTSYQLVYAEGNQMSGPAAVNIPAAAPGQTIDVSVNLVAPGASGDFTGKWRLRASNNAIFGGYTVVIKVVGTPTPTATATRTPTPIGGGLWGGTWMTDCAGSTCGEINLVQTGSTVVGTYAGGAGTLSGSIEGNRLSGAWARGGSSGTFDFWIEDSGLRWHGNWDRSNAWCGQRADQSPLVPCGVSRWYGAWTTLCGTANCGDMTLTQSGDTVTGSYAGGEGSISGTVTGATLTGAWSRTGGSGPFKFFMTGGGLQFQGNYSTDQEWCGYRSGSSAPAPCLKN